jgi:polar amino acid transport system substrate-binding protein
MRIPMLALLAVAVPAVALAGPDCKELVITGHPSYPPVSWTSGRRLVGAAPDLVTRIAAALGVAKVTSTDFGSWENAQTAARGGEADVIFGIYRNEERKEFLDYVEPPFMMDPVAIVVRKGAAFPFAEWTDLKGRKGVTNAGESYGDRFDAFLARELTVARASGVERVFTTLLDGKADYAIVAPGSRQRRDVRCVLEAVEMRAGPEGRLCPCPEGGGGRRPGEDAAGGGGPGVRGEVRQPLVYP